MPRLNGNSFHFGVSLNGTRSNCDGSKPYETSEEGQNLEETTKVGSYPPNAWKLHDMHGNVWEWCYDRFGEHYYANGQVDPRGPDEGSYRVCRGGSWSYPAQGCRAAFRTGLIPSYRRSSIGFRVALASVRLADGDAGQ